MGLFIGRLEGPSHQNSNPTHRGEDAGMKRVSLVPSLPLPLHTGRPAGSHTHRELSWQVGIIPSGFLTRTENGIISNHCVERITRADRHMSRHHCNTKAFQRGGVHACVHVCIYYVHTEVMCMYREWCMRLFKVCVLYMMYVHEIVHSE